MSNYYIDTINLIQDHIKNDETEQALEKLYVELSMPYIPEEHKETFEMLLHGIKQSVATNNSLFTNFEDIEKALQGSELQVVKALQSLENMNLRPILEDVRGLFTLNLDDTIKRILLMQIVEQEISMPVQVELDGIMHHIETQDIEAPFENEHYQKTFKDLVETYESYDPSYLNLAIEILNAEMMASFPFIDASLNMKQVIQKLEDYMNKG